MSEAKRKKVTVHHVGKVIDVTIEGQEWISGWQRVDDDSDAEMVLAMLRDLALAEVLDLEEFEVEDLDLDIPEGF